MCHVYYRGPALHEGKGPACLLAQHLIVECTCFCSIPPPSCLPIKFLLNGGISILRCCLMKLGHNSLPRGLHHLVLVLPLSTTPKVKPLPHGDVALGIYSVVPIDCPGYIPPSLSQLLTVTLSPATIIWGVPKCPVPSSRGLPLSQSVCAGESFFPNCPVPPPPGVALVLIRLRG